MTQNTIDGVSIIGAGDMGHGLAVHFAAYGHDVTLIDHRESNIERATAQMQEVTSFLDERELVDSTPEATLDRIETTLDLEAGVADNELIIESISEDLDAKQELFGRIVPAADEDAILSSNTSGIPITEIAESTPEAADRIVGCHWWFPPYLLRPVEVVRGEGTADRTVDRLASALEAVDRDPIRVERDIPGFVWNRVQFAVVRECLHLAEEGVASLSDINRAIRDGYAVRTSSIGPLETMDIVGLDLAGTVATNLYPELSDADEPQSVMTDRIEDGRTGIGAGEGFFEYDEPPEAITGRRDELVAAVREALDETRDGLDSS